MTTPHVVQARDAQVSCIGRRGLRRLAGSRAGPRVVRSGTRRDDAGRHRCARRRHVLAGAARRAAGDAVHTGNTSKSIGHGGWCSRGGHHRSPTPRASSSTSSRWITAATSVSPTRCRQSGAVRRPRGERVANDDGCDGEGRRAGLTHAIHETASRGHSARTNSMQRPDLEEVHTSKSVAVIRWTTATSSWTRLRRLRLPT